MKGAAAIDFVERLALTLAKVDESDFEKEPELAQSETPCVWRSPLCGTWETSWRPQPRLAVPPWRHKASAAKGLLDIDGKGA